MPSPDLLPEPWGETSTTEPPETVRARLARMKARDVILRVEHLGKLFRTGRQVVTALHDICFHTHRREFLCVIGPSGCGKSTLIRILAGLPEILMVPLPGHSWGHAGVAVRRNDGRWLLHAGDAYFYRGEMRRARRRCTPGLRAYQRLMEVDATNRLTNQERLRILSVERSDAVTITCAHDHVEFERCRTGTPL